MSADETLEQRARRLAAPVQPAEAPDGIEYVTFRYAGERYALESSVVTRLERLPALTHIPGVPKSLLGAITLRGEIVPVASLAGLLDLSPSENAHEFAIVLGGRGAPLAIAADELGDIAVLATDDGNVHHHHLIRGVTRDAIVLLDAGGILADPRLLPVPLQSTIHQENAL